MDKREVTMERLHKALIIIKTSSASTVQLPVAMKRIPRGETFVHSSTDFVLASSLTCRRLVDVLDVPSNSHKLLKACLEPASTRLAM